MVEGLCVAVLAPGRDVLAVRAYAPGHLLRNLHERGVTLLVCDLCCVCLDPDAQRRPGGICPFDTCLVHRSHRRATTTSAMSAHEPRQIENRAQVRSGTRRWGWAASGGSPVSTGRRAYRSFARSAW